MYAVRVLVEVPPTFDAADWFNRAKHLLGENPRRALTESDNGYVLTAVWEPDLEEAFELLHRQDPEIRARGYEVIFIWNPDLQEPYLHLKVCCPEEYIGIVNSDLNRRRGWLFGVSSSGENRIVQAYVPASELCGYMVELLAMTKRTALPQRSRVIDQRLAHNRPIQN